MEACFILFNDEDKNNISVYKTLLYNMIVDFSMICIPHTAFLLKEYVRLCPIIIEIINGSHELVCQLYFRIISIFSG